MRVLVTGITGFAGRHLTRELLAAGHVVWGLDHVSHDDPAGLAGHVTADLRDEDAIRDAVRVTAPEACVHLAAVSSVVEGQADPGAIFSINIGGTLALLNALADSAPRARVLVASSSQIYGPGVSEQPVSEDSQPAPHNAYAVSKVAADLAALAYPRRTGLQVVCARPENHTGPGQSDRFVVAAFAAQVRAIRDGRADPEVRVGNLESIRGFTDVRDVVRAYRLLLENGSSGKAYNIASGYRCAIGDVLDTLCRLAGVAPRITVEAARVRPPDASPVLSTRRIEQDTGWTPCVGFEETLRDMLHEDDA